MQHSLDGRLCSQQPFEGRRVGDGLRAVLLPFNPGPNLDFSALEVFGDVFTHDRLGAAQLVAYAKAQVQKAAVDRANLQTDAHLSRRTGLGVLRCGGLATGVASHAVNGHVTMCFRGLNPIIAGSPHTGYAIIAALINHANSIRST